jgi:hypothetical protein
MVPIWLRKRGPWGGESGGRQPPLLASPPRGYTLVCEEPRIPLFQCQNVTESARGPQALLSSPQPSSTGSALLGHVRMPGRQPTVSQVVGLATPLPWPQESLATTDRSVHYAHSQGAHSHGE